ncbi:MAG: Eco57I restriction-modification methylase domain-containing protein [Deltaproteobacteria bacterium]|jgi:site-specific DNA-methyltransferase (adenine-specific)|nr:Eco57I restriction-modification methylase domain-containing protein [Deltaproteobacteria bacterium]
MTENKLFHKNYNPDVLNCLANLSNDEVFTPPEIANKVLDILPQEIFSDKTITFLDPACKSGVFLREIARRLLVGLEHEFPVLQDRIDHIFHNQLFGVSITELSSLLSRRTVYCSKYPNSIYSVTKFDDAEGNIRFKKISHSWNGKKCIFCGARKAEYERDDLLESHAYEFIHISDLGDFFKMKFDVIIGNPPYQLNDGGGSGTSAIPIYHRFVEQAIKLKPRFMSMIIPARWYTGGKGLDAFRQKMLNDPHLIELVDFCDSRDCFPGVDIAGGICYFLWDRDKIGLCKITSLNKDKHSIQERPLNEFNVLIRDNLTIDIVRKVISKIDMTLEDLVSSRNPFGLDSREKPRINGDLILYSSFGKGKIESDKVKSGFSLIDKWKVLLSKTSNDHAGQPDKSGKRRIFSRVHVMPPGSVCTESYLVVGCYDSEEETLNLANYLKSFFCRFLVSSVLLTQNITKNKFCFVPIQDFSETWTDDKLYNKYGITDNEIVFIESMIRPMEIEANSNE